MLCQSVKLHPDREHMPDVCPYCLNAELELLRKENKELDWLYKSCRAELRTVKKYIKALRKQVCKELRWLLEPAEIPPEYGDALESREFLAGLEKEGADEDK